MDKSDNVVPLRDFLAAGGRRFELQGDHLRVINACRQEVATSCSGILAQFFDKLDDVLFQLSEKTAGTRHGPDYFTAMRELRRFRSAMEADFLNELVQGYDRFWQLGPALRGAASGQVAEMKLLGEDELDESLAIAEIVSRAEKRFHHDLVALDRRFSFMLQGAAVSRATNPVAPAAFTRAMQHVLTPVGLEPAVKLIVYKLFDSQVVHYTGGLYDELNSRLDHSDILPGLTSRQRSNPVAPVSHPEPGTTPTTRASAPGVASQGGAIPPRAAAAQPRERLEPDEQIYVALRGLLQSFRRRQRSTDRPSERDDVQRVATADLLGVLGEMQRSALAMGLSRVDPTWNARGAVMDDLKKALKLGQTGEGRRTLRESDLDTIDMISMLFDFIVHDRSLPDAMKSLLARLQIPMLKVALLDRAFFRSKGHPARQLLNQLSRIAVSWTDDGDRSEASLYGRIESIVSRVVVEFATDPGIFEAINREVSEFVKREQQSAGMTEERTRQVSRGKEQLRTARCRVDREIGSRLSQRANVPEVVCNLLLDAWKDVLLLTYLRQGPESPEWEGALAVAEKLLWSVEPRTEPVQRQQLLQAIPTLLADLRTGLTGIAYDHNRMAKLFKDLQALHITCLRGKPGDTPVRLTEGREGLKIRKSDVAALEDAIIGRGPIPAAIEGEPGQHRPDERFLEAAGDMPVGSWLDLHETNGRRSRVKLAWKSDDSELFVFVNRKGVKVAEMTANMLAGLLSRATAEVLDVPKEPLMDRALADILERLRAAEQDESASTAG